MLGSRCVGTLCWVLYVGTFVGFLVCRYSMLGSHSVLDS